MGYVEELRKLVGHRPVILVGSLLVLEDEHGRILLQKRREPYGYWGLPGGLMELGESTEETARREMLEETGYEVGELALIGVFSGADYFVKVSNGDEFYIVIHAFYADSFHGTPQLDEAELLECRFIHPYDFPNCIVATHQRVLKRFFQLKGKNLL